jgi:4-amino-4-deoxy-L-arabinose transferase-like glycosyltransferase
VARRAALLVVVVVMALAALVRWRLAGTPLERDEGEYAYAGQLILQGIPPYQQAYNMKFPGIYYAYALSMALFGETPRGIRLGLILVNAGTTLLLFALGRRLLGELGGAVAGVSFVLLSLDRGNLGVFAHATHYILLPALAGLYLLIRAPDARRLRWLLASGALLGVAVLMKQHAFVFLPLGVILLGREEVEHRRHGWRAVLSDLAALAAGALVPVLVLGAVLLAQGVLGRFWFWTFQYARAYVSEVHASAFLPNLRTGLARVSAATWPLWLAGGVGFVALWVGRWPARTRFWVAGLLAASFLGVCPGFHFRDHYFILLVPALALLAAVAVVGAARLLALRIPAPLARFVSAALFTAVAGIVTLGQAEFLFAMTPRTVLRTCYGVSPFTESVEVARYILEHTTRADRIAVLGSEPQIYFYAHRLSATGYIYVYPLTEPQPYASRMQDEMMAQIEAAHPRYLVFVQETSSWNLTPASDRRILDWAWRYVRDCYQLVGLTDIFSDESRYVWGDEARRTRPASPYAIFVYERASEAPCSASPAEARPSPPR